MLFFPLEFKIIYLNICFMHPTQATCPTDELCLVACARQIHLQKKTCTLSTGLKFKPLKIQINLVGFLLPVYELANIQYNFASIFFFSHLEKSMALSRRWCYHMNRSVQILRCKISVYCVHKWIKNYMYMQVS